jgi:hypothetical protein
MKTKNAEIIFIVVLSFEITGLFAQVVIPASGGNAKGSGGTIDYTLGQMVYTSHEGTNGALAQGVQQPYEIWVITEIDAANRIALHCSVEPNPVVDDLILTIESADQLQYSLSLYDINGKIIENQLIVNVETIISMEELVPSVYLLKVFAVNEEVKTFKIIKNK